MIRDLVMRKLLELLEQWLLTLDENCVRMNISNALLEQLRRNKSEKSLTPIKYAKYIIESLFHNTMSRMVQLLRLDIADGKCLDRLNSTDIFLLMVFSMQNHSPFPKEPPFRRLPACKVNLYE
ncbi:hypothetical protein NPIL_112811 [Nephila pilipes]|uniref:Uncharacterized protein n=1 Tax=Nephila pilipes TaxID=299642 RepID=A0A8X6Q3E8_NEPPI|nr:hypothetical protein NPIL_112811 [Nephila pilipes]